MSRRSARRAGALTVAAAAIACLFASVHAARAQEPAARPAPRRPAPDVFLDCRAPFCDFDHFRREIDFVNWVRDREDSDVHVLVTAQPTGGGGWAFAFAFIGRRAHAARTDTLSHVSRNTDTDTEIRTGLTHTLKLGLVRYAATTAAGDHLEIMYAPPERGEAVQVDPAEDPWNFWTFRVSLNGSLQGEARQRGHSVLGFLGASRTTEALKIDLGVFGRFSRDEFELDDTTTFVSTSEFVSGEAVVVWSLGRRWSAGLAVDASRSTFSNRDFGLGVGPALEYNIFPYAESTRRQITFLYLVEGVTFDYEQITVEGKRAETLARHRFFISTGIRETWGSVRSGVEATQYLHDPSFHRIELIGSLEVRVVRGLSFDLFGRVERIKDQFFLPAGGLTQEEILVRRRQRETDFRFDVSAGLSFRFGSKFANVVNPRMSGAGFFF